MKKKTVTKGGITSVALAIAMSLIVTGCAGIQNPLNLFGYIGKEQIYESGIPELVELEKVEDEFGSYTRTTIEDPLGIRSTTDSTKDKAEAEIAKAFIIKFIVEEALDSIALDNESQWATWKKEVAPKYLHPDYSKEILDSEKVLDDGGGRNMGGKGVILVDVKDSVPTLFRDGSSRSTEKLFKNFIIDEDDTNPDIIYVYSEGSAFYPVRDEDAKPYVNNIFGEGWSEYVESLPPLNDGKDQIIQVDFNVSYTLKNMTDNGKYLVLIIISQSSTGP